MPSLKTIVVQVTPFVQNASIVICTQTNKCAFVDPGGDIDTLLDVAKSNNLIPEKILLTDELKIEEPSSENDTLKRLKSISKQNEIFRNFIGMGYYNSITPNVILRNILENPGWYTSYTPYQPEVDFSFFNVSFSEPGSSILRSSFNKIFSGTVFLINSSKFLAPIKFNIFDCSSSEGPMCLAINSFELSSIIN